MVRDKLNHKTLFCFLAVVYMICVVVCYAAAQRLYGNGKVLTQIHVAWILEAIPWLIACASSIVLSRIRVIKQRTHEILLLSIISLVVTLWLVMQPTAYSMDILRYLWDGRLVTHGLNPYTYVPMDPHLTRFRTWPYWGLMAWKNWPEAYPPLAQLYFGLIAFFTNGSVVQYKALLILNDIASFVAFYLVLVKHRQGLQSEVVVNSRQPNRRKPFSPQTLKENFVSASRQLTDGDMQCFALFALFPPLLFESFGSAHVDVFAIPWLLLAWLWQMERKPARMGFAIAMATCIKLYPVVLFAALIDLRDRKGIVKSMLSFVLTMVCLYAFFYSARGDLFAFYTHVSQMDYNGSLEYVLYKWFGPVVNRHSTLLVFSMELIMWILVLFTKLNRLPTEQKICILGLTFILTSPIMHPWYLVSLLPFAIVAGNYAALWLAIASHLTYDDVPLDMYIEYIPTYGLFIWNMIASDARSHCSSRGDEV